MQGKPMSYVTALALAGVLLAALPAAAGTMTGTYRGQAIDLSDDSADGEVSFRVAKRGRLIKSFKASPVATCVNPNAIGGIEVVEVPFVLDGMKVKPNGRFAQTKTFTADPPSGSKQTYNVSGRLSKGRVRGGRIVLERRCSDQLSFTAGKVKGS